MDSEVDFGTTEVNHVYESYIGNSGSLTFDPVENIVVFENYEPRVSVTFLKGRCIIR
jgi:hypothetical protein